MTEVSVELAVLALLGLFVVSLVGGLLPQVVKSRLSNSKSFLRVADVCAAGILASAAFVHLLPDATESLQILNTDYPAAGAFVLVGATAMYFLDVFAHPGNSGYVLAVALSGHALIEGLALGASAVKHNTFSTILFAILFHKAFGAFALSSALVGAGVESHECAACALIFALVTPLGALTALIFVRQALEEHSGKLVSAVLTAVSAGIFAYIALAELLPDKHSNASENDMQKTQKQQQQQQELPLTVKSTTYGSTKITTTSKPSNKQSRELICACNSILNRNRYSDETRPVSEKLCACVFLTSASAMSVLARWT